MQVPCNANPSMRLASPWCLCCLCLFDGFELIGCALEAIQFLLFLGGVGWHMEFAKTALFDFQCLQLCLCQSFKAVAVIEEVSFNFMK